MDIYIDSTHLKRNGDKMHSLESFFLKKSFIPINYCNTQQNHFDDAFLVDDVVEFVT